MFEIMEEDKLKVISEVKKHLMPEVLEDIKKQMLMENKQVIGEGNLRLDFAKGLDIGNNGKKDIIGVCYLSTKYKNAFDKQEARPGLLSKEIFFILWDTGEIEKIAFGKSIVPAFSLGGAMDIDQDGIQEIILQWRIETNDEWGYDGRQIEIMSSGNSGW